MTLTPGSKEQKTHRKEERGNRTNERVIRGVALIIEQDAVWLPAATT